MSHVVPDPQGGRVRVRRKRRGRGVAVAVLLTLAAGAVALLAGCGGGSEAATTEGQGYGQPDGQSGTQTRQIMMTVQRSDVAETAFGRLELTDATSEPKATVQLTGDSASKVAAGQTVTAMVGGRFQGGEGQPSGAPSAPPDGSSDDGTQPSPPAQDDGQGMPPGQGDGQGMGPGGMTSGEGGVEGTVLSVESTDDGVTAIVQLDELPDGAEAGDQGMAVIQIELLAEDVLVVPVQAIDDSDGKTTVTVISNGETEEREVGVGAESATMAEIVSGLNEGDNIVYEMEFSGMRGGQNGTPGEMGSPPPGDGTQDQTQTDSTQI